MLHLYVEAAGQLHAATTTFLGERTQRTPFVIGVAGSVAVGKSTIARVLREMLSPLAGAPAQRGELITTDGFLYPLAELKRRQLLERQGLPRFPYDRRALLRFVERDQGRRRGSPRALGTTHVTYDIVPGKEVVVRRPDVLIVEGLNVLAPARPRQDGRQGLALSDFFDFSIYVDAKTSYIEEWYVDRFRKLRTTAFAQPESYFHRYATLSDTEAEQTARDIWKRINEPNLEENVLPTRGRAQLVLHQGRRPLHPPDAAPQGLAQVCYDKGPRSVRPRRSLPARTAEPAGLQPPAAGRFGLAALSACAPGMPRPHAGAAPTPSSRAPTRRRAAPLRRLPPPRPPLSPAGSPAARRGRPTAGPGAPRSAARRGHSTHSPTRRVPGWW